MIRVIKLGVALVAAVLVLVLGYLAVTFWQVRSASEHDNAQKAQAIVVLGAAQFNGVPSSILRARLDHALDLYRRGLAPYIVVTGGKQPGDRYTEATASANYLLQRGVPDRALLREVSGRSSWDSLAAAAVFLKARAIHEVLLVSDPFHSYRIVEIASELGLRGHASPTRTSPITGRSNDRHLVRETLAVAIGRVIGYRREAGIRHVRARVP